MFGYYDNKIASGAMIISVAKISGDFISFASCTLVLWKNG